jgi:hypothetical protein
MPTGLLAQKDYLVTVKGDTLTGKVMVQQNGNIEQVLIKVDRRQTFPATAVREILMRGDRYKPVQFSGAIKFMKIITDGYLSVLGFQPPGIMYYDGRLLQMRDGRLLEVPTIGFKKQMSNYLKDYTELATKIEEGDLDRKDLDQIVNEYNAFISSKTTTLQVQAKTETVQRSKLEMLSDIKKSVEQSSMDPKQDLIDMMLELEGKIKDNKQAPAYLLKLISDRLQILPDLSAKFDELVKQL